MPERPELGEDGLTIMVSGDSNEAYELCTKLQALEGIAEVKQESSLHHVWDHLREGRIDAIVVDYPRNHIGLEFEALAIFSIRIEYPQVAFALLVDDDTFESASSTIDPEVASRLSHYYRIPRSLDDQALKPTIDNFRRWKRDPERITAGRRYKYDVALSFAGEQRHYAAELAKLLQVHGVRVFYDDFEQARLWGTNLYDFLYKIYSEEARFCIVFVSQEYASKVWTIHERRSAQERVLQEKDNDYLLPIRVDGTRLPGLPTTVAYIDIDKMGVPEIARLFVRKLGIIAAGG